MKKNIVYYPLTAAPLKKNPFYTEITPCRQLDSYIRCFWGTAHPVIQAEKDSAFQLVIPDTCADIIYSIDYTENTVSGGFCGVNDHSFYAYEMQKEGHLVSTFAIRFYAWTACVFAQDSLKSTLNGYFEAEAKFEQLDRMIRPVLLELKTLEEKTAYVQQLLMQRLAFAKENITVKEAVSNILMHRGTMEVSKLAKESFVSSRQLERLFQEYIGMTPKKLSCLVRYQFLWRDILCVEDFQILNAVHQYGYTDQSHLMREFKRFHSMDIQSAKRMAFADVANIQDSLAHRIVK